MKKYGFKKIDYALRFILFELLKFICVIKVLYYYYFENCSIILRMHWLLFFSINYIVEKNYVL